MGNRVYHMEGHRVNRELTGKVLVCFLFLNTFLMLFLPKATVGALRWYEDNSITIQFVLLALMAAAVIIFRKRIRWDGQR